MMLTRHFRPAITALALLGMSGVVLAQGDTPGAGQPVSAPTTDDGGSLEVGGIDVDVAAKSASAARYLGWRLAQRKGWAKLAERYGRSGGLSDGALDSVVSGIVIEKELVGGNRYIARLGVQFNRGRAGAMLGIPIEQSRSAPMLLVPVMWSAGAGQVFEQKTPWIDAWTRFRSGNSSIDYVRPAGSGPDSLLMTTGQVLRPGRGWWRAILGQYDATNVLIPVVHLYRQWPGGPVIGTFQARFGPDNKLLGKFSLRVSNSDALPALMDEGVKRIDALYQRALASSLLAGDPGLAYRPTAPVATDDTTGDDLAVEEGVGNRASTTVTVQIDTPNAGSVTAAEAAVRAVPGVHSAVTTSLALGAISVMRVSYDGDANALATALEARGWRVSRGTGAIRIERAAAPSAPPPDTKTGG
ncbi:MAG: heavy-metal-associated domain-containing protein [Sphingomonas sp.]|jgi:hypothetical protein